MFATAPMGNFWPGHVVTVMLKYIHVHLGSWFTTFLPTLFLDLQHAGADRLIMTQLFSVSNQSVLFDSA